MKKFQLTVVSVLVAIVFSACDRGSSNSDAELRVQIDVNCTTPVTQTLIDSYVTMFSGDVLVQEDNTTSVVVYHDLNDTKKVCLESGSAYLIR